ncbi:MAG: hypothetical protein UU76_C0031G0009, partial [Parcubacteria group bacterium GW2011_GWC1_41_7]
SPKEIQLKKTGYDEEKVANIEQHYRWDK